MLKCSFVSGLAIAAPNPAIGQFSNMVRRQLMYVYNLLL